MDRVNFNGFNAPTLEAVEVYDFKTLEVLGLLETLESVGAADSDRSRFSFNFLDRTGFGFRFRDRCGVPLRGALEWDRCRGLELTIESSM